ncbi:MAG TPA: AzlD domain-containing protein [Pseudonocardiaceae bacterium]|jgi:branched-subunit amino acid transport protein|nr:AzlD domain-containing protein [Pseudonocardiaceae bacterium]
MTLAAILVLAAGTYAYRIAGPLLRGRIQLSDRVRRLLLIGAAILLLALVSTSALAQGHGFAGWARPAGVGVGALLAIRKAPFLVVVLAAVATTALLRLAGVP